MCPPLPLTERLNFHRSSFLNRFLRPLSDLMVKRGSSRFCRLVQRAEQPQRSTGVVPFPVAVVHPVSRIGVWCGVGILWHGVEGQWLYRLRKRRIGVRVFSPAVHKQQKVAFPPCRKLRE